MDGREEAAMTPEEMSRFSDKVVSFVWNHYELESVIEAHIKRREQGRDLAGDIAHEFFLYLFGPDMDMRNPDIIELRRGDRQKWGGALAKIVRDKL